MFSINDLFDFVKMTAITTCCFVTQKEFIIFVGKIAISIIALLFCIMLLNSLDPAQLKKDRLNTSCDEKHINIRKKRKITRRRS